MRTGPLNPAWKGGISKQPKEPRREGRPPKSQHPKAPKESDLLYAAGLKRCGLCKEIFPATLHHFKHNKNVKSGLDTYCKDCNNRRNREAEAALKLDVFTHYSGGTPKCACCGSTYTEFLTLDHINGDGAQHRRELKGRRVYRWVKAHDYPSGFQVLCMNCNFAKGMFGFCPHDMKETDNADRGKS